MGDQNGTKDTKDTKKPQRLIAVRTTDDVMFFGIAGRQVAESMNGIHLAWNGEVVVVTSDSHPGESRWIFPATIAFVSWSAA